MTSIKFNWIIFCIILILSATACDVDHFLVSVDGGIPKITNWHCMTIGFWSGVVADPDCQRDSAYGDKILHDPYIAAIFLGLALGGLIKRWHQD